MVKIKMFQLEDAKHKVLEKLLVIAAIVIVAMGVLLWMTQPKPSDIAPATSPEPIGMTYDTPPDQ